MVTSLELRISSARMKLKLHREYVSVFTYGILENSIVSREFRILLPFILSKVFSSSYECGDETYTPWERTESLMVLFLKTILSPLA
jgi:hypothetical protein